MSARDSVTRLVAIRPRETLNTEIRLRQWAPLDSAWQRRPDLYARSAHVTFPGGLAISSTETAPLMALPYPPGHAGGKGEHTVALQVLIGRDATLMALRVVSPDVDPDLARAALAAAILWSYTPNM